MPKSDREPSSTQIGAIAESLVANALMVESAGRFSPFWPIADDDGIDLLIYDKETGRAIPVQVKSRTVTLKRPGTKDRGDLVHFEVRTATFKSDDFAYLVAVLLKTDFSGVERAWLIPMHKLASIARHGREKFVIRASRRESSNDRFSPYRCESPAALTSRLASLFEKARGPRDGAL